MPKHKHITVKLLGQSGNAFAIVGKVIAAMKAAECSEDEISAYRKSATASDYDNLLRVTMDTVNVK